MRVIRFLLWSVLFLCVGLPLLFLCFVFGMAAFGVVIGVGMAMAGMMISILKLALMIILPVALVVWLAKRMSKPSRVY